ncbi:hypothetical protein [Usitatibacter palustris]|uniref:Adenylate kinase n=1 Tax=Usitatibacter palustris TaxID=2732487 RepID=A0A6M4H214_9PROT|nr:hypothetical protein [Usitatibacter palustris]QJR13385.1 hypothetical protein DSM104440_00168 [Usitatibacter palustris]
MKRILVIGCNGSGKTVLARWLAEQLKLPLVVLDAPADQPEAAPPEEAWRKTVRTLADRDAWVMDGTYYAMAIDRLPPADGVVWLDFPRWRCVFNLATREHARMPYLRHAWGHHNETRARIGAALQGARYPTVVILRSSAEVSRFRSEFGLPA